MTNSPVEVPLEYPYVSPELLRYFREHFPNRLPPKGTDLRDYDFLTGQQFIIEHLATLAARQEEEDELPNVHRR